MTFEKMPVDGCCLIKRNIPWDDRGCFSRLADIEEFKANGLNGRFVQISASKNYSRMRKMPRHSIPSGK